MMIVNSDCPPNGVEIGSFARVPVEGSLGCDYDKLKRIGHLARVPIQMSVVNENDKLKRVKHLVRAI